jgi:SAM-dependent methyltransferase
MTPLADPLPPPFDPHVYRQQNPALAALDDAAALAHYIAQGCAEGLVASPLALREGLLDRLRDAPSALEIGPFCNPLLTGDHIAYLDVLDAAQLRARAAQLGRDPSRVPATIHHVGGLDQVDHRYAAAVSSHAIEHQPDLVRHLEAIARVLEPGGRYYLIVPDKRYCFDHFIAESTIADVLDAWREERQRHPLARVIEHAALTTHNDPERHWRGDHGDPRPRDRVKRLREALSRHDQARECLYRRPRLVLHARQLSRHHGHARGTRAERVPRDRL